MSDEGAKATAAAPQAPATPEEAVRLTIRTRDAIKHIEENLLPDLLTYLAAPWYKRYLMRLRGRPGRYAVLAGEYRISLDDLIISLKQMQRLIDEATMRQRELDKAKKDLEKKA